MIILKNLNFKLVLEQDQMYVKSSKVADLYKSMLRSIFKSKCYKQCLILDIKKIIKTGNCESTSTNDGKFTVDIDFLVEAVVYDKNETCLCKILKKNANYVEASSDIAGIRIRTKNVDIYKIGDIVPVTIQSSVYPPMKSQISITHAIPFRVVKSDDVIYVTSMVKTDKINNILDKINDRKKQLGDTKSKSKAQFIKLMNIPQKGKILTDASWNGKSAYISTCYDVKSMGLMIAEAKTQTDIIKGNDEFLIINLLSVFLQKLETLLLLIKQYPTKNDIDSIRRVWGLFQHTKKTILNGSG